MLKVIEDFEERGGTLFRNVRNELPIFTASYPERLIFVVYFERARKYINT